MPILEHQKRNFDTDADIGNQLRLSSSYNRISEMNSFTLRTSMPELGSSQEIFQDPSIHNRIQNPGVIDRDHYKNEQTKDRYTLYASNNYTNNDILGTFATSSSSSSSAAAIKRFRQRYDSTASLNSNLDYKMADLRLSNDEEIGDIQLYGAAAVKYLGSSQMSEKDHLDLILQRTSHHLYSDSSSYSLFRLTRGIPLDGGSISGSNSTRNICKESRGISTNTRPVIELTSHLEDLYKRCNQDFKYSRKFNPRRVLTKQARTNQNDGFDNEDADYILYVHDILGDQEGHKYIILDLLGQGTFGQVVKCQNTKTKEIVAIKVIKNKPAYFNQSMIEVTILEMLNQRYDSENKKHIVRLLDTFTFRKHLCLVFEVLSVNLYELIKQNQFRGLSTSLVRVFVTQMLEALCAMNEAKIIHCDLKPENILLKNLESPDIKIIDFGSACHEQQTVYTYIQSRFYRAPEILLGVPYSSAIDMWSLGCIAAELFLGLPVFPGSSEYNQISRIVDMLGNPPKYLLELGKNSRVFFEKNEHHNEKGQWNLKSIEKFNMEYQVTEKPSKRYFQATTLSDLIMQYPYPKKILTQEDFNRESQNRKCFLDFLNGLLNWNPIERWSPQQAKMHAFISGTKS